MAKTTTTGLKGFPKLAESRTIELHATGEKCFQRYTEINLKSRSRRIKFTQSLKHISCMQAVKEEHLQIQILHRISSEKNDYYFDGITSG